MTVIESERLAIRRFTPDDAELILRLLNEPSFLENIGDRGVRTAEDAARYLEAGPIASYALHGHGLYLVALRGTGEPVGMCGLLKRDHLPHPDLGYALLPEFWSSGYALEAARAVLEHGWRDLGLTTVLATVKPANAPSVRVLEKLGFAYVGPGSSVPGRSDAALYAIARPPA